MRDLRLPLDIQAAQRSFERAREEETNDLFWPDIDGFFQGWAAHKEYIKALERHRYDDSHWRMAGVMLIGIGGMLGVASLFLYLSTPASRLVDDWEWRTVYPAIGLLVIGIFALRRGLAKNRESQAVFDERWYGK
jgi:hypothetical protein